jgi:predicted transport protein
MFNKDFNLTIIKKFSTSNTNPSDNDIVEIEILTNDLRKICLKDFSGDKPNSQLNRTTAEYQDQNDNLITLDKRSWAFIKFDLNLMVDKKSYRGFCLPLLGSSALLKFKRDKSTLGKTSLNQLIKKLGIKPVKPDDKSFKTYGGLLLEEDVQEIVKNRPLDFDQQNFLSFTKYFTKEIERAYSGRYVPLFFSDSDNKSFTFDFQKSVCGQILAEAEVDAASHAEVIDIDISIKNDDDKVVVLGVSKNKFFHLENVVYCFKYQNHPNNYYIGHVYNAPNTKSRFLHHRLKEHFEETRQKPIIIFAFKQDDNYSTVHPEQLEIRLQMAVAEDLVDLNDQKFDLKSIRQCGSFGFSYPGSEADLTRICFSISDKELLKSFIALTSLEIKQGNREFLSSNS